MAGVKITPKLKLDVCDMCGKLKPNVSKLVDTTDFLTSNVCQDCLHMPQEMLEKLPERKRFKIMLHQFTEDVRLEKVKVDIDKEDL